MKMVLIAFIAGLILGVIGLVAAVLLVLNKSGADPQDGRWRLY
jgi:cation transporter-like permease